MKYLHTMVRVKDLDLALDFFCTKLGLKEIRRRDHEGGRFTLVFLATEEGEPCIELTHNWETNGYALGDGFGHIAISVEDAYAACDRIRAQGGNVVREAGPMQHGSTVIAFVEDPDGYKIELIQTA